MSVISNTLTGYGGVIFVIGALQINAQAAVSTEPGSEELGSDDSSATCQVCDLGHITT